MTAEQGLVIVVDDDLAVRESLKFALELEGLAVHTCGSGAELLGHPELPKANCVILDYMMPTMNGFEVLDALAARKMQPPVILLTSHATDAVRTRAATAGVRQVLEKPLLDAALVNSIQDILSHPG